MVPALESVHLVHKLEHSGTAHEQAEEGHPVVDVQAEGEDRQVQRFLFI